MSVASPAEMTIRIYFFTSELAVYVIVFAAGSQYVMAIPVPKTVSFAASC